MGTVMTLFVAFVVTCFLLGMGKMAFEFVRENYLSCLFWFLVLCFFCPQDVSCHMDEVQDAPRHQGEHVSVSDLHPD